MKTFLDMGEFQFTIIYVAYYDHMTLTLGVFFTNIGQNSVTDGMQAQLALPLGL